MDKRLTPKHLEVLLKFEINGKPIKKAKLLPYLNILIDLTEYDLLSELKESYKLSDRGTKDLNKILENALKDIKDDF